VEDLPAELVEAVVRREAVLFAGAGVSAVLDVPTAQELVELLAREIGYDVDILRLYGELPALAEFALRELPPAKYAAFINKLASSFRRSPAAVAGSAVHESIVDLDFRLMYTTNYDDLIETAYQAAGKELKTIRAIEDLKETNSAVPQLVKFHGDFSAPSTMILTEASYFDRLQVDSPLDIRFRADVIGRPILFVGYSLKDVNLRYFLYRLSILWASAAKGAAPTSYVVVPQFNPVEQTILENRGVQTIVAAASNPAHGLQEVLASLRNAVDRRRA